MTAPPLRLRRLKLRDFRSWPDLTLPIEAGVVVITGENGAGKTNLLEAVSLLAPGRGLRGARTAEFARRGPDDAEPRAWAVAGRFDGPEGGFDIGTGTPSPAADQAPVLDRRTTRLDGVAVRAQGAIAARVAAVWLTPQMDRLLAEGAGERRRFLDRLAIALEPAHGREVAAYETAMAGRNRLLRRGGAAAGWLAGLEDAMARHGVAAAAARRSLVTRLDARLGDAAGPFPAAGLALRCLVGAALDAAPALAVEDQLRAQWAADRAGDAAAGLARHGPHRSDLMVTHRARGVPAAQCSTGEQKALLIAIILAHAGLLGVARGFAPILLLDEVAAHLDPRRRGALFAALAALPAQTLLTGTDPETFAPLRGIAEGFRVAPGQLVPDTAFPMPAAA